MEAKSIRFQRKDTGRKVQLSDSVFGIEPNNHAVYLDVKQYLTTNVKERTKLKKELKREVHVRLNKKGTGTARAE
jgi:large subunit ribosomal protein L4